MHFLCFKLMHVKLLSLLYMHVKAVVLVGQKGKLNMTETRSDYIHDKFYYIFTSKQLPGHLN